MSDFSDEARLEAQVDATVAEARSELVRGELQWVVTVETEEREIDAPGLLAVVPGRRMAYLCDFEPSVGDRVLVPAIAGPVDARPASGRIVALGSSFGGPYRSVLQRVSGYPNLTRQQIIESVACPKCRVEAGSPCLADRRQKRRWGYGGSELNEPMHRPAVHHQRMQVAQRAVSDAQAGASAT